MNQIPYSPAEAVDVSFGYKVKMNSVLLLAKLFKFWDYPYKNAATDFEEMNWRDVYYWVHKTTHPIIRPEKGVNIDDLIDTDDSQVGLPSGFKKQHSITMGTCGDLLYSQEHGYPKDELFENVADLLFNQDISFVNMESPVTTQKLQREVISNRAAPLECCSREQFNVLKGYKDKLFTVMNTANNHTFDFGIEGMETTQKVLAEEGIINLGVNSTPAEYGQGKILIKDGIKLGFVSVTFGLNGHQVPQSEKYRIHVSKISSKYAAPDLTLLKRQIDYCKEEGCDFIIAALHWGYEFELFPREQQIHASHAVVELGADAIISCHTHVIQPVEYYRTKRDSNRVAVIAYSLGSLAWGYYSAPYLVLSLILNLTLSKGEFEGKSLTYIEKSLVTPVFRSIHKKLGKWSARIEKLADFLNKPSSAHSQKYIGQIRWYADLVLGKSYLLKWQKNKDSAISSKAVA